MQQVYEFLQSCGQYFLVTVDHDVPQSRPFASLMEYEGCLFFATSTTKMVYHQLRENPNIQIVAKKKDSYAWIRISASAQQCEEEWIKEEMMEISPRCKMLFASADDPTFAVFRICNPQVEYN